MLVGRVIGPANILASFPDLHFALYTLYRMKLREL